MSNEQPPHDDDQAAAKGWTSGEITRTVRAASTEPTLAEFREYLLDAVRQAPEFQAGIMRAVVDLVDGYTANRAGTTPDDPDALATLSRDYLVYLARAHRNATRTGGAALDGLLDQIALDLDVYDVRIMRGAWAAITDAMPRIALAARQNGKSPDEIAQATGYTSSRIAQFIRQEKRRAAAVPLTQYTWRIDVQGADGEWTDREVGDEESTPADLPRLAERLLAETGAHHQRARIFLWEGDQAGADADAVHTAERGRRLYTVRNPMPAPLLNAVSSLDKRGGKCGRSDTWMDAGGHHAVVTKGPLRAHLTLALDHYEDGVSWSDGEMTWTITRDGDAVIAERWPDVVRLFAAQQ